MRTRAALALLILLVAVAPVLAQDCDSGYPCGRVPWRLPGLPGLNSPTPMPTRFSTVTPTPSGTPAATPTPTATIVPAQPTVSFDATTMLDQMATLQAVVSTTPQGFDNYFATYEVSTLEANAKVFFGYVSGLSNAHFGVVTPLLSFILFAVMFMFGLTLAFFLLPAVTAVIRFFRSGLETLLGFF